MISIKPRSQSDIPNSLLKSKDSNKKTSIEKAFEKNLQDGDYSDENNLYKQKDIQSKLREIYNNKCAYCELKFIERDLNIDHYRPKKKSKSGLTKCNADSAYYWLAYSFSNLIPLCPSCNRLKSNCFDIEGRRVLNSDIEKKDLEALHFITKEYNDIEKPKFIHPEYDKSFEKYMAFNRHGKIMVYKKDDRDDMEVINKLRYTIKICGLNSRRGLVKLRLSFANDFINLLNDASILFRENPKKNNIKFFKSAIKHFRRHCSKDNNEFLLLKRSLIHPNKIVLFLKNKDEKVVKIIQRAIMEYAKDILIEFGILNK